MAWAYTKCKLKAWVINDHGDMAYSVTVWDVNELGAGLYEEVEIYHDEGEVRKHRSYQPAVKSYAMAKARISDQPRIVGAIQRTRLRLLNRESYES